MIKDNDSVYQRIARRLMSLGLRPSETDEAAAIIDAELAAEACPHAPQTCQQIMDDYRAVEQYVADVKRLLHLPDNCVLGVSMDSIRENIRKELEAELAREPKDDMFWPNDEGSLEFHLYEIRHGKSEAYVREHAKAVQELARERDAAKKLDISDCDTGVCNCGKKPRAARLRKLRG